MKSLYRPLLALCLLFMAATGVKAAGWPANFQGVMLQGFYWDSYTDTKWTNLESQADELSKYFKLIWVPNSAKSASQGMGYDPVYWFTNHNTRFGTEAQIRSMIQTFKAKGTGIIADVVINHRSGKSNWTDFPEETWNGQTWKIGLDGICRTDEVNQQSGQAHGTGAADTGEDFSGSRDLDHTNANVQNNCKNYCKFLLQDMGYAGFRLDMVKGYAGQYTKIYNQYANPTYCVGEYWDGSYDALAAWIEATGRTSAAFDYALKYVMNDAFSSKNYSKLVWKANGTTDQPAGLIHYAYPQYAVTFIENHDTDGNGTNAFSGNIVAANAFILCSPGTPCVYLKHWKQYKAEIKKLIEARNLVGVTNTSTVNVLRATNDCYMAEVTGTKGKLVVKIGPAMVSPSGYTDGQIYCSGTDYCVWTTNNGGVTPPVDNPTPGGNPTTLYMLGNVNGSAWSTSSAGATATGNNGVYTFSNVKIDDAGEGSGYFSFATTLGADWDAVNSGDRYGAPSKDASIADGESSSITLYAVNVSASGCQSWMIPAGTYTFTVNLSTMTLSVGNGSVTPPTPPTPGTGFTVYFDNSLTTWANPYIHYWGSTESSWPGVPMSKVSGNVWKYVVPAGTTGCLFNAGDGDATKTSDFTAVANHIYNTSGDQGEYKGGDVTPPTGDYPATVYMLGNVNGADWSTSVAGATASGNNGVYKFNGVTIDDAGEGSGYFSFATVLGADWDAVNGGDRYGSEAEDTPLAAGGSATVVLYAVDISAMGCTSWMTPAGKYDITLNLATMKVSLVTAGTSGPGENDPQPPTPGNYPATVYMLGNVNGADWSTSTAGATASGNNGVYKFNGVTIDDAGEGAGYFSFATVLGADWDAVNGGDRYGSEAEDTPLAAGGSATVVLYAVDISAMGCTSWMTPAGKYDITLNLATMKVSLVTAGTSGPGENDPQPPTPGNYPSPLYMLGNVNGSAWSTSTAGAQATPNSNGVYTFANVKIDDAGEGSGYFSFATVLGADWDAVNEGDRYGAAAKDTPIADGQSGDITLYAVNVSAMGCEAWMIPAGTYTFTVDLKNMKLTVGGGNSNPGEVVMGDANGDNMIDATDIAYLIDAMLNIQHNGFVEEAADLNGDNKINATDISYLIRKILGK